VGAVQPRGVVRTQEFVSHDCAAAQQTRDGIIPKDVQGAIIADIDAESPAAKAGLREGDVIQEVNKQPVKSAKDLLTISKKYKPNEKILMRVYGQGGSGYVALGANK
jgi:S1-C subfamily serine protease